MHTWSHPDLALLTRGQIISEIGFLILLKVNCANAIQQAIGVTPKYIRLPYVIKIFIIREAQTN